MADGAREALLDRMVYLSQEYWDAGWMDDLHLRLERYVRSQGRSPNGARVMVDYDWKTIARLHDEAGGWWVWDESVGRGGPWGEPVRFVPDDRRLASGD